MTRQSVTGAMMRPTGLNRRQALLTLGGMAALTVLPRPATAAAQRIVSVGGAVTEIVFALGAGAEIVAVDTTSLYPAQAVAGLPKVGYLRALSAEGLLSTKPDLILLDADAGPASVIDQLTGMKAPIARFSERPSAQSVPDKINFVGKALDRSDQAAKIADQFSTDLKTIETAVGAIGKQPKVLFLMSAGTAGLRGAGSGTAAAEMIALAGGRNAFGDATGYKTVSGEAALAADPDVILLMQQAITELGGVESIAGLPVLAGVAAAKQRRIYGMDGNYLLGFGPRTAHAARDLAVLLHPDAKIPALPDRPWTSA